MPIPTSQDRRSQPQSRSEQADAITVSVVAASGPLPAVTVSLPADYEELRERLHTFSRVPPEHRLWVMGQLLQWRQRAAAAGKDLPAPWIFAPDLKTVEFEWEIGNRELVLTMNRVRPLYALAVDHGVTPPRGRERGFPFPDEAFEAVWWVLGGC